MSKVEVTTLDNGLRIASQHNPSVETVTSGVWLNVGARLEPKEVNGVAHVLEHMAFKGTKNRTAKEIAEVIENVGGYMNAYTSRENTAYYTRVLKDDIRLSIDIISDILQNSTFDAEEFKKEQSVIIQEIGQSYDTPDDIIFDYFQETCFPNQAMGRPILGTVDIINSLTPQKVSSYMYDHYGAKQMVLAASGNIKHADLVDLAKQYFTSLPLDKAVAADKASYKGGSFHEERDLEQVHIVAGFEGVPYKHPDYYSTALLATILGGGMSSRLFQEIREKRGLVYSIYAFHSAYTDAGIFGIYAGTSAEKVDELLHAAATELKAIKNADLDIELNRAKAQLKASLMMSMESTSSRCEQIASQMHIHGRPIEAKEILQKIEAVDTNHIKDIATKVFSSAPTLTTLGPLSEKREAGILRVA